MAKQTNLSKLSVKELEALQKDVAKELENRKEEEKKQALQQIQEIAKQAGFSLGELVGKQAPKPKPKVRYRDPENPKNTWAGRGRKPKWLEQALAEGKNVEDFAV